MKRSKSAVTAATKPASGGNVRATTKRGFWLSLALCLCLAVVGVAAAFADEAPDSSQSQPSAQDYGQLLGDPSVGTLGPLTDREAAEQLPHADLDRGEALELLQAVFGEQIEGSTPMADGVEVLKYYSNHVALVASDQSPAPGEGDSQHNLLESFLPLRTEDSTGQQAPVDLSLEHTEGELQPSNPLVEVGIPSELGDGIALPESEISIELAGAPADRSPSTVTDSTAFFPNVAPDTDLTVAPTPIGVETLTQLRSPNAPTGQTFNLTLPKGAELEQVDGGAQIVSGQDTLAKIPTPTAIDAEGNPVDVSLEVSGTSLVIDASPTQTSSFPILVDPLIESYHWTDWSNGYDDWYTASNSPNFFGSTMGIWGGQYGLNLKSTAGTVPPGSQANWNYYVPRYFSDYESLKVRPTSYIDAMNLSGVYWWIEESAPYATFPVVAMGLWDENKGAFATVAMRSGAEGPLSNTPVPLPNKSHVADVKNAGIALLGDTTSRPRHLWVPQVSVELTDSDYPSFSLVSGPSKWVNETAEPISFVAGDNGLGVYSVLVKAPSVNGGINQTEVTKGCTGGAGSPCPRAWNSNIATYNPKVMAQGEDFVELVGRDPVLHFSDQAGFQGFTKVKVDHTKPTLPPLSGTVTEQGTLGTWKPTYTVKYNAADGEEAAAEAQTPFGTTGTAGEKTERPIGVATDGKGNVWVVDRPNNRVMKFDESGKYLSQFGAKGSGNGQLLEPRGIAISSAGNIWITDTGNNRVQEFNEKGEYIRQFGSKGSFLNEQFTEVYGIATTPNGMLWVGDTSLNKVREYREVPESGNYYVRSASAILQNGFQEPAGIAAEASGSFWVGDSGHHRVLKFDSQGNYLMQFGTPGTGNGQFQWSGTIAIAPSGHLFVVDNSNNRIQEFKPDGTYLRQFGSAGTGSSQFNEPRGIAVGAGNQVFVADAGNHRVARWTHADQDPQSGVASTEVKVDGAQVDKFAPGCATRNCTISRETTLDTNKFAVGQHTLEVIATDGVGLSTTSQSLKFESHPDKTAPSIALSGSMTEQATYGTTLPSYTLKVAATDPGGAEERKSGVVSSTIKVDGTTVKTTSPGCPAEGCSLNQEWTLDSSKYSTGAHTVEAIASDGAGLSTTKTLTISIAKDETAPKVTEIGPFFTAPEGWVEQKTYSFVVFTEDPKGYGVTSLAFKIDGKTAYNEAAPCSGGGCALYLFKNLNMATYKGGEHAAEVIATDGAGNVSKRAWTINVDPKGAIGPSEAEDTLEAAESTTTSGSPPIVMAEEEGSGLVSSPGKIEATNTSVPMTMAREDAGGFQVEPAGQATLEGTETGEAVMAPPDSISISPLNVSQASTNAQVANDAAALVANSFAPSVDSIVRPVYDGAMTFQNLRDTAAPTDYSWVVQLDSDQSLKLLDPQHAQVYYEGGHAAFSITAIPAHDAIGTAVPTELTVEAGGVLTLRVLHHSANFVYPVVAGAGWEGGFSTYQVVLPPAQPTEPQEPVVVIESSSPPERISDQDAGVEDFPASDRVALLDRRASGGPVGRAMVGVECPGAAAYDSGYFTCGNPWKHEAPGLSWNAGIRSQYVENRNVAVWHKGGPEDNVNCAKAQWNGINSTLQVFNVECKWKYKRSTADRNYIASRGDWHVFTIDATEENKGYYPLLSQMFTWGCRRTLGKSDEETIAAPDPSHSCQG